MQWDGGVFFNLERVKGIEPSYEAWEAAVLPLNYTRVFATGRPLGPCRDRPSIGAVIRALPTRPAQSVPEGCGVLVLDESGQLIVARAALHRPVERIPFGVWMALAKAQPIPGFDDEAQELLGH